ncbi:hypothetical protein CB1_000880073 [Camelus ferus]|nr:hypothetical protein CB1_000880073 [Camelus ferus]
MRGEGGRGGGAVPLSRRRRSSCCWIGGLTKRQVRAEPLPGPQRGALGEGSSVVEAVVSGRETLTLSKWKGPATRPGFWIPVALRPSVLPPDVEGPVVPPAVSLPAAPSRRPASPSQLACLVSCRSRAQFRVEFPLFRGLGRFALLLDLD